MSDNPKVTDKSPSLVIPGYIESVKGEPLTRKYKELYGMFRVPRFSMLRLDSTLQVISNLLRADIKQ